MVIEVADFSTSEGGFIFKGERAMRTPDVFGGEGGPCPTWLTADTRATIISPGLREKGGARKYGI